MHNGDSVNERAFIRPIVSRSAETQEILASVVQTARQRELDLAETITTLLRTPAVTPLAVLERRSQ